MEKGMITVTKLVILTAYILSTILLLALIVIAIVKGEMDYIFRHKAIFSIGFLLWWFLLYACMKAKKSGRIKWIDNMRKRMEEEKFVEL